MRYHADSNIQKPLLSLGLFGVVWGTFGDVSVFSFQCPLLILSLSAWKMREATARMIPNVFRPGGQLVVETQASA